MPYLHAAISGVRSENLTTQVSNGLLELTARFLGKKKELTSIAVDYRVSRQWSIGGVPMDGRNMRTFSVIVYVTSGTNSEEEKSTFIRNAFEMMQKYTGATEMTSYVIIQDIPGNSWGYGGQTQKIRN
jgi:4-oxalocrotonate tautomerase